MHFSWKTYTLLSGVFLGSFLLALSIPPSEIGRQLAAIPGGLSLIGALYQLIRDEAAYQKALLLQQQKQEFDIAITSHMANVAYDKHVAFCEEYVDEMQKAFTTIWKEGFSVNLLGHASALYQVQRKHSAWLTTEIENGLDVFESALRKIGAHARHYKDDPSSANATGAVREGHNLLEQVFGFKVGGEQNGAPEVAMTVAIGRVRKVIGIEELTNLRNKHLQQSNPSA